MIIRNGIIINNIDNLVGNLTDRECDFLLGHFNIFNKYELICNTNRSYKIELIKSYCTSRSISHETICNILDSCLINKSNFEMINKNDFRKILFILDFVSSSTFILPLTKSLYDYLIYSIDIAHISNNKKINDLNIALRTYNRHKTQDSQLKWIDFSNTNQTEWAIKYLQSKYRLISFFTVDTIHSYDPSLIISTSLDCYKAFLYDEKSQFIERMRKSWSQQKFRDAGKTKTKHHLPLTKQAKRNLKKLALFKNKSESEILEELINESYLLEMCDDEGKALY